MYLTHEHVYVTNQNRFQVQKKRCNQQTTMPLTTELNSCLVLYELAWFEDYCTGNQCFLLVPFLIKRGNRKSTVSR